MRRVVDRHHAEFAGLGQRHLDAGDACNRRRSRHARRACANNPSCRCGRPPARRNIRPRGAEKCRNSGYTASAVPRYQVASSSRCCAGSRSRNSFISGRRNDQPICRCRNRLCALYWVRTPIRRMPELTQFDIAKSMMRNLPPKNTAGLARRSVNCCKRLPRPPASTSAMARRASLSLERSARQHEALPASAASPAAVQATTLGLSRPVMPAMSARPRQLRRAAPAPRRRARAGRDRARSAPGRHATSRPRCRFPTAGRRSARRRRSRCGCPDARSPNRSTGSV